MRKERLTMIYTGNGKGKTTAALGVLFRAFGHGMRCCVIQFIKKNPANWGEYRAAGKLGIHWENYGCGFTWKQENLEPTIHEVRRGFKSAVQHAASGKYDILILDELTYPLTEGWIDRDALCNWLDHLPETAPHIIITGRKAPDWLQEKADMVSEIMERKHHFKDDIAAQKGIEF